MILLLKSNHWTWRLGWTLQIWKTNWILNNNFCVITHKIIILSWSCGTGRFKSKQTTDLNFLRNYHTMMRTNLLETPLRLKKTLGWKSRSTFQPVNLLSTSTWQPSLNVCLASWLFVVSPLVSTIISNNKAKLMALTGFQFHLTSTHHPTKIGRRLQIFCMPLSEAKF